VTASMGVVVASWGLSFSLPCVVIWCRLAWYKCVNVSEEPHYIPDGIVLFSTSVCVMFTGCPATLNLQSRCCVKICRLQRKALQVRREI